MTLELLFLKAGQCRTFLTMVLLGAGMALLVHLAGALHRRKPWLGMAADVLLAGGILKAPMVKTLPAAFSWPQLVTALLGGAVALTIVPALKKALHRS